jgi:thiol:disulfide interchange protein
MLLAGWLLGLSIDAEAAAHTRASLVLAADTARPGDTVLAGIRLQMDPKWHTYWKNSGDSGMPTELKWELPKGVTAGEIQWPVPLKLEETGLTTYIYKDETVLLVPLRIASDAVPGRLQIKAKADWLECDVQCVPGKADLQASLAVGPETKASGDAALLERWAKQVPQPAPPAANARANWAGPAKGNSRPLVIAWSPASKSEAPDFLPDANDDYEVQAATELLPAANGGVEIRKVVKKLGAKWPQQLGGILVERSGDAVRAWQVTLKPGEGALSATTGGTTEPPKAAGPGPGLWLMLLYAFIGGVILNLMPCVLPVIALKILGFVTQAQQHPAEVRRLGLVYGLGVLVSFAVLAALIIALKAAGKHVAWGMQFSSPQFTLALTVLVTLVALNLFGLFEITVSGKVMDTAGRLSSRHGTSGAFFNGVFTTLLATPCTAPLLGYAIGFAFAPSQTAGIVLLILLTVGIGLALPYVLLSWYPAWLKYLPKPGAWMERFKIAMGFPMLATAVWLLSLLPTYYGERSWWAGVFLVIVALAAWVFGEFAQRGRTHRQAGIIAALTLLLLGYAGVLEKQVQWRVPLPPNPDQAAAPASEPGTLSWQPWSPDALAVARSSNRPVLVDFTAKWCVTCNTIVKAALGSASVRDRVRELNVITLLGDYTRFPPAITEELARHGRAGVPLVLVYPKDATAPPIVLPEALTPGMIVDALNRAANAG